MAQPIAGTDGKIVCAGVTLALDTYKLKIDSTEVTQNDFTTPYRKSLGGLTGADITASGYWDADQPPHTDPPGFITGELISACYFYVSATDSLSYYFPQMLCVSFEIGDEVDGKATISLNLKSYDIFYLPGNVPAHGNTF